MDDLRLEIISKHIEEMDSGLVDMLKRYIDFTKNEKPRVAVLCSNNQLRIEMEQIFTVRTDVDAVVYKTYSEDENIYDMMLSDAVIAVTSALQTAPKGIYSILKELNSVSKEVYVLIGGWDALPKKPDMLLSKLEKITQDFYFSKIVSVKNYYSKELECLVLPEQAAEDFVQHIKASFERQHSNQSEKLYTWLKKRVASFYDDCNKDIDKEILLTVNSIKKIYTKQSRFALEFTHSGVPMQNLSELAAKRFSDITFADIDDTCGDIESMARGDERSAERSAKRALIQLLVKALDSCIGEDDSPVKIKSRATADDCVNEMREIDAQITSARYISNELKDEFTEAVENIADLDNIVEKYDGIARLTLDRAKKRIPAVVKSYRYTMTPQTVDKLREIGKNVIKTVSSEKNSNTYIDDLPILLKNEGDDFQKKNSEDSNVDHFLKDTENMLKNAVTETSDLVYECGKEVTKEINDYSELMIKGYFGRISAVLQHIEKYLEELHNSYILE